jgi:hypothetical protein
MLSPVYDKSMRLCCWERGAPTIAAQRKDAETQRAFPLRLCVGALAISQRGSRSADVFTGEDFLLIGEAFGQATSMVYQGGESHNTTF